MKDYSMQNRTYKYFQGEPVFAFGHGLTYSEINETWTDEDTAIVQNNGPYDTWYSVLQYEYIPHKSLKNFKKIFIRNGETVKCSFGENDSTTSFEEFIDEEGFVYLKGRARRVI